jgi:signal transduction histidine kinase
MALLKAPRDPKLEEYLTGIGDAGRRAKELVQQILTFSRQTEQIKKPIQLSAIVKEALKLLRAAIPATIRIQRRIAEGGGMVLADPTQVNQVVMNLGSSGKP